MMGWAILARNAAAASGRARVPYAPASTEGRPCFARLLTAPPCAARHLPRRIQIRDMSANLRAYIATIVLVAAALVFLRWVFAGTPYRAGLDRRAKYWLIGTSAVFLIPSFWLVMVFLGAMAAYAARRDERPVSVYLMLLLVAPAVSVQLSGFGPINNLLAINYYRVLSLTVLLPLAGTLFYQRIRQGGKSPLPYRVADTFVAAYVLFMLTQHFADETTTMLIRRFTEFTLDLLLPYYVISRACRDKESVLDALMAFVMGLAIMAVLGIFEHFKGWLLYQELWGYWGLDRPGFYLMRGDALRAEVSAGHSLVLGHNLVMALALTGLLSRLVKPTKLVLLALVLLLGLYSTVSRGPWLAAVLVLLAMGAFHPRSARFYGAVAGLSLVAVVGIAFSPYAERLISFLPFVGTVDTFNVSYRQQLLDTTFLLVSQRPFLGSTRFLDDMEHLRQGQGIIDLVNVYAQVALGYGLIGLSLFVGFLFSALISPVRHQLGKRAQRKDRSLLEMIGFSAIGLGASMFMLVAVSNHLSIPLAYTSLAALLIAMSRLPKAASGPAR
jgi:O-antigen ligase